MVKLYREHIHSWDKNDHVIPRQETTPRRLIGCKTISSTVSSTWTLSPDRCADKLLKILQTLWRMLQRIQEMRSDATQLLKEGTLKWQQSKASKAIQETQRELNQD